MLHHLWFNGFVCGFRQIRNGTARQLIHIKKNNNKSEIKTKPLHRSVNEVALPISFAKKKKKHFPNHWPLSPFRKHFPRCSLPVLFPLLFYDFMQNANKAARQPFDTLFGFLHPGRANQISINSANNANTGALITARGRGRSGSGSGSPIYISSKDIKPQGPRI